MTPLQAYPGTIPSTTMGMQVVLQAISRIRLNDQTLWNALPSQWSIGVVNGSNAPAGAIGEYISTNVPVASQVVLTSTSAANIASINLTPGDWDVSGNVVTNPASVTTQTKVSCCVSTSGGAFPTAPNAGGTSIWGGSVTSANPIALNTGLTRINTTQNTTAYLVGLATFSNSTTATVGMYGYLAGRRAR